MTAALAASLELLEAEAARLRTELCAAATTLARLGTLLTEGAANPAELAALAGELSELHLRSLQQTRELWETLQAAQGTAEARMPGRRLQ